MKRIGLAIVLASVIGGGLAAAPARAEASIDELRECVDGHLQYFADDPAARYYVFTMGVYMCGVHYAYRATSTYRLTAFRGCMYRAVQSYDPYLGVEPPVYYARLCVQDYFGFDPFGGG